MKKYTLFALLMIIMSMPLTVIAQSGTLITIAGNGTSGFSGDGGVATAAKIGQALMVTVDGVGNIYIADADNSRIRKVTPSGIISTVATVTAGAMTTDAFGDVYFVAGNLIQKLTVSTGGITTVAGTGVGGYSGDGGPATSATLNAPHGICFDRVGNLYIGDEGNYRVRKVSTSGIITTYAGNGTSGFSGDGGPATAARLQSPDGLCVDVTGNMYIADRYNYRIRKIDPSGVITTYAGSGASGFTGDGGPASASRLFEPSYVCSDAYSNLYIADFHNSRIRKVTPAGIISTFAGGGASTASGVPATSASFSDTWGVAIDWNDNIYIPDRFHYRICRVDGYGVPTVSADSFFVTINNSCTGMNFRVVSNNWSAGQHVITYFGNGHFADTVLTAYGSRGMANMFRPYSTGTYSVKHVLYNGTTAIDSVSYTRNFSECQNFGVQFYYDANGNCIKDGAEIYMAMPLTVKVDSAGIAIDTIPSTSGLFYTAYGGAGTVYRFTVISSPPGTVVCGTIIDTINSVGSSNVKQLGFSCTSTTSFDLRLFPSFRAGPHHFGGTIIADNLYCLPQTATLTMQLSPTYNTSLGFSPPATTISGDFITWNIGALSSVMTPVVIHADMEKAVGARPAFGDTVMTRYTINPISGDDNPADNAIIRVDTVQSGYDPNDIAVTPGGCLTSIDSTLQYTIHFENTGNDTAFNIYVLDTLPSSLDAKSIRIVTASATMFTSVIKSGGYNIVKFDFPAINLLDSSHHGYSDGMVIFKVNVRSGLPGGTPVNNRAGIYFDYNPVVLTNTAENVVGCVVTSAENVQGGGVTLRPNPTSDILAVETGNSSLYTSLSINNAMGQRLIEYPVRASQTNLDVSMLPPGLYYLTLKGEQGNVVKKFVKL